MKKLLFIYNANSGIGNMVLDVAHKLFSPKTYNCKLCALTYDTFSENLIWKDFRKNSNLDFDFLHLDEFKAKYQDEAFSYPVILDETAIGLNEFLSTEAINAISSIEDLILVIKHKIS